MSILLKKCRVLTDLDEFLSGFREHFAAHANYELQLFIQMVQEFRKLCETVLVKIGGEDTYYMNM